MKKICEYKIWDKKSVPPIEGMETIECIVELLHVSLNWARIPKLNEAGTLPYVGAALSLRNFADHPEQSAASSGRLRRSRELPATGARHTKRRQACHCQCGECVE